MKNFLTKKQVFKDFADKIPFGILLIDVEGKCVFANESWTHLTGFTIEETLGEGWFNPLTANSRTRLRKKLQFIFSNKREIEEEIEIVTPDGLVKWLHLKVIPLFEKTKVEIFSVVIDEITAHKKDKSNLIESEEKFETIINRASDMIYEVSLNGDFSFINPVVEKILGYSKEEFLGKNFLEIVYPTHRKTVREFYEKQLKKKDPQTYLEFPLINKNGKKLWVGQNVTLTVRNGQIIGVQGFAREITEQKLAERSLLLQDSVVKILASAETVEEAIVRIIESIGQIIGWQIGCWWKYHNKFDGVNCKNFWKAEAKKFGKFEKVTILQAFRRGEGIPGRVLKTKKAVWINNLQTHSEFLRLEIVKKDGLKSGFWFPVLLGNEVHGIFEFISSSEENRDDDLLQIMGNIGSQIGQFIQRKRAENEMRESDVRKSAILESALDCIITMNSEGEILEFNPAAEETFGYKRHEAVGQLLSDLIMPPEFREAHQKGIKHYLEIGEHKVLGKRIEIVGMRRDGTVFPVELAITPIFLPNSLPIFTGYLRDITKRKNDEEELRLAKEEAEAASIAKSQFLAMMSHEIRTPLNAIIGLSDLAVETEADIERINFLHVIQENSENLLSLINDLLDFSKIEAEQIDIEQMEFDLGKLLENVISTFVFKAFAKGLEFGCKIDANLPEKLVGDPNRLRQVLVNLVSNAVKFTETGEVFLKAEIVRVTSKTCRVQFTVKDTGIGIAAEYIDTIFEKFSQADVSTSRKYGGTGLGLSITKSLVNLMNGGIEVSSELGNGSSFIITMDFPVAKKANQFKWNKELKNRNLLLVEENESIIESFNEIFKNFKGKISISRNADECLELLEKNKFDIVFIDENFHSEKVHNLTRLIKKKVTDEVKIILLTRKNSIQIEESSEIDLVIQKPCCRRKVYAAVCEMLGIEQEKTLAEKQSEIDAATNISAKILLVEDSKVNRDYVERILDKAGYQFDTASNGLEAIRKFSEHKYDLILMDIEMPEMDGFQATTEIRRMETSTNVPIIALTAHAIRGYREKCLAFGMNDYITKPLRREHLIKLIGKTLGKEIIQPEELPHDQPSPVLVDEAISDLVEGYLESCRRNVEEVRDALDKGDYKFIERIGHNCKGSGSGYGFDEISAFGKEIENNAQLKNGLEIIRTLNQMEKYLDSVRFLVKT